MIQVPECRILVVDDDEDTRFTLSALLKLDGYAVSTAGTVEGAVKMARAGGFDLYVLDKRYPDGDGAELCHALREYDPRALVVIYSGAAYNEDREEGFTSGAEAYVTKPNIDGLLSVVEDLLKGKRCAGEGPDVSTG